MHEGHDLELLLKSHHPIVVIESLEEPRLLQRISQIGVQQQRPVFKWSLTDGLGRQDVQLPAEEPEASEEQVLWRIRERSDEGIYILCDYHPFLNHPLHVRLLRDIAQCHERSGVTLVLLSHRIELPPELSHLSARAGISLPNQAELEKIVMDTAREWRERTQSTVKTDHESFRLLVRNLSGLGSADARRLARTAIFNDGTISADDLPPLMQAKHRMLRGDDVLSYEFDTAHFAEVAGLHKLKGWLEQRRPLFHGEMAETPLDPPRGLLLLGVQGGGKSLAAKATAGLFNVPLLRLDFAAIYNKYHGETERNLRESLATAEAMAPCVLWIDEIEKGISTGHHDGGTSQRVLGTLLTWMAERKKPVFLVATANDIERLPAELVRKGRFDEIFFIDLPTQEVREAIFAIHLEKRQQESNRFDRQLLAEHSDGFSGAEIEQAVVSALYSAHAQQSSLETEHILEELLQTRPLSVVMAEPLNHLRHWAAERTVPAD
ncbi:MAG: AAA family ATPase [Pseudomonadota bacterium]